MRSIFKPALVLMSGRALGFVAAFLMPVVLVRIFDQAEFGTYKQLFVIYFTLFGIVQLGMAESLYYFLPGSPNAGGRYAVNSMLVLAAAGLVSLGGLVATRSAIAGWMNNSELARFIPSLGWYLLLTLIAEVLERVMVARRRYLVASLSYGVSDLLRAGAFIVPVLFQPRLEGLLIGAVGFAAVRLGATLGYLWREFGGDLRPDTALLKQQLAYALPFALAVLVETVKTNYHHYVVSSHVDAATFAIYAVGCLQIPLIDFVAGPACNVMMVGMSEEIRDGRAHAVLAMWHDTTRKLALVFFPLVGLLLVNARDLIVLLFTENYLASVPIFMVWSTAIVGSVLQTDGVLRVYAQTRFLFVLHLIRTYLKIVDSMTALRYRYVYAALERRTLGTDSGTFSRGTHPRGASGPQARPHACGPGSGPVDSEHRRAVAHATAVLSQLQNGASPLSAMVRTRGAARDPQAVGQYAARRRRD